MVLEVRSVYGESRTIVRMLMDCGADRVFVSRKIASKIEKIVRGRELPIGLPDRRIIYSNEYIRLMIEVGSYRLSIHAMVTDLPHYDVILGLTWFESVNPRIDWVKKTV